MSLHSGRRCSLVDAATSASRMSCQTDTVTHPSPAHRQAFRTYPHAQAHHQTAAPLSAFAVGEYGFSPCTQAYLQTLNAPLVLLTNVVEGWKVHGLGDATYLPSLRARQATIQSHIHWLPVSALTSIAIQGLGFKWGFSDYDELVHPSDRASFVCVGGDVCREVL